MKRFSPIILCLATAFSFIISCDDDSVRPPKITPSLTVDKFPDTVGQWWQYQVYDSLNTTYDTVMVICEDTVTIHGGKNTIIWVYHHRTYEESLYVNVSHDTVAFFNDTSAVWPIKILVFPLANGRFWIWGDAPYDTVRVTQKNHVATPICYFNLSFQVSSVWNFIDNTGDFKTWIAADVGIIKERREWTSLATTSITHWELIDCAPFPIEID